MKILSAAQSREADQWTMEQEPIRSIDLMERASKAAVAELCDILPAGAPVAVLCGMGNNGGDGLAIARLLAQEGQTVAVFILRHREAGSPDFEANLKRWKGVVRHLEQEHVEQLPTLLEGYTVWVDAILGAGLERPLRGFLAQAITLMNSIAALKIAIDLPTGLPAEVQGDQGPTQALRVQYTLTFQHPKRSLLHVLCQPWVGQLRVLDIGLSPRYYQQAISADYFAEEQEVKVLYRPRSALAHKGTLGHGLLIAGSPDTPGAALLAAEAMLRGGLGLLTAQVPEQAVTPLLSRLPEAMIARRQGSRLDSLGSYEAVVCGPGLGQDEDAAGLLKNLIQEAQSPLVLDADALNLLAENPTWLAFFKTPVVLTPHPGEWRRLIGEKLDWDYPERLRAFAERHRVYVVLKNSISTVATPGGRLFYTQFGTAALATAGSGDVLAGLVGSLLAQGYEPLEAILGALFLHGKAGRAAGEALATEAVLASDILGHLGEAFRCWSGQVLGRYSGGKLT